MAVSSERIASAAAFARSIPVPSGTTMAKRFGRFGISAFSASSFETKLFRSSKAKMSGLSFLPIDGMTMSPKETFPPSAFQAATIAWATSQERR